MRTTLALLLVLSAAGCADNVGADAATYKGHRLAAWAVTKSSGDVAGFAQELLKPEQQVTLEPIKDFRLTCKAGPIKQSQFSSLDGHKTWKESTVALTFSHGTGSATSTYTLTEPRCQIEWGLDEPLAAIVWAIPEGALPGSALKSALPAKFTGDKPELEDLLLVAAARDETIDVNKAAQVYGLLRKTTRQDEWTKLMLAPDPGPAKIAAAALSRTGDAAAQDRLSRLALQSKGNEQLELVEVLLQMPPTDRILATMVDLIIADRVYLLQTPPGVAAADKDRRYRFIKAVLKDYTDAQLRPHAQRLLDWAKAHHHDELIKKMQPLLK